MKKGVKEKYLKDGIKHSRKIVFNIMHLIVILIDEMQKIRIKCNFFSKKVVYLKIYG